MQKQINTIVVLGGGSAGFLSALAMRARFSDLSITLIRSKELGIIGVGEGTFAFVPTHLHGYLGLDPTEFHAQTNTTWKLGTRFEWGQRDHFFYTFDDQVTARVQQLPYHNGYYLFEDFSDASVSSALMGLDKSFASHANGAPDIRHTHGYHIENERFVGFLERAARQRNIQIIDGMVEHVNQDEHGIVSLVLADRQTIAGDFFIDCSGFSSLLLGKTMKSPKVDFKRSLYCDRAIVGNWDRTNETIKPYTTSQTMEAGWCWQIEHPEKIIRGYVHSSDFISEEQATAEFLKQNPRIKETRVIRWPNGYHPRPWVKNVVAIGNASGFVEPLEATAIAVICSQTKGIADLLYYSNRRITDSQVTAITEVFQHMWLNIRDFLAVHYRFNNRLDTPFWRACVNDVWLGDAEGIVEYYQANGPDTLLRTQFERPQEQFGLEGFYTMLIGLKVPFEQKFEITDSERKLWNQYRAQNRSIAMNGIGVKEAMQVIRLPQWSWNPAFYDWAKPQ